jgi:hypothetical protein
MPILPSPNSSSSETSSEWWLYGVEPVRAPSDSSAVIRRVLPGDRHT